MRTQTPLLLRTLAEIAKERPTLPPFEAIGLRVGLCYQDVNTYLADAEKHGLIRVERDQHGRRIAIAAADDSWRLNPRPSSYAHDDTGRPLGKRKCAKCSGEFKPKTRFRFLCDGCARANGVDLS